MTAIWNGTKTAILMGGLMGLALFIGYAIGGPGAMAIALVLGGAMNLIAFFFSDKEFRQHGELSAWRRTSDLQRAGALLSRLSVSGGNLSGRMGHGSPAASQPV